MATSKPPRPTKRPQSNRPVIVGLWRVVSRVGPLIIPDGQETEEQRAWGVFLHGPRDAVLYRGETVIAARNGSSPMRGET